MKSRTTHAVIARVNEKYQVVVIGAGHAGCEAAFASARMGMHTVLLSMNLDTVAIMSCNPAIGGLAKGHLVREVDALGGLMGLATDQTGIQFRMLNTSKGPAVRAPRAQADKQLYSAWVKRFLESVPGLDLRQGTAEEILHHSDGKNEHVVGVRLQDGTSIECDAVIVASGTFLEGIIHIGSNQYPAGRAGECSSEGLAHSLRQLGFTTARLKTGTPARLDGRSIDWTILEPQYGDEPPPTFSYLTRHIEQRQVPCYITYTNPLTHSIITDNLGKSAMYGGHIKSVGPRYCPSIEDKCVRFADRERHQLFLEPEGLSTHEIYVNGASNSLPEEVQRQFIHSIKGLEQARFTRIAYAIEYTFVPPSQIHATMHSRHVHGLFLAGQINGTTGYEEAAAQGLVAGANAALYVENKEPLLFGRNEAYIGVLCDDLVTKEHREPYRMFTSRAEYRLLLRQDNADLRLMDRAFALGLVDSKRHAAFCAYRDVIAAETRRLRTTTLKQSDLPVEAQQRLGLTDMQRGVSLAQLLARPELHYADLEAVGAPASPMAEQLPDDFERTRAIEQVELAVKYEGYLARQTMQIERAQRLEDKRIPADLDYGKVRGLTTEATLKLNAMKPATIGQASRIAGVNPADISVLLIYLRAREPASR